MKISRIIVIEVQGRVVVTANAGDTTQISIDATREGDPARVWVEVIHDDGSRKSRLKRRLRIDVRDYPTIVADERPEEGGPT